MSAAGGSCLLFPARILSSAQRAILSPMCNLYSITKGQAAIRELARAIRDRTGNLPTLPWSVPRLRRAHCPHHAGRRARTGDGAVGIPSPAFALKGKKTDPGVTNVRNTKSAHWRCWLGPDNRCLVPFTSFSEPEPQSDGKRPPAWFALGEDRPLAFFAGIWSRVEIHPQSEGRGGRGGPVRVSYDGAERRGRVASSQGDAGRPHRAGGDRDLDDSPGGRCPCPAAAFTRWRAADRGARAKDGRRRLRLKPEQYHLRETVGGEAEVLIGKRTYRAPAGELRPAGPR